MKNRVFKYNVVYTEEPEGGFTAVIPALPGCVTYGKDLKEAKKMAKDAVKLYLESLRSHKEKIPTEKDSFIGSIDLEFPHVNA